MKLWRVWINGRWQLVAADSREAAYRAFRPARRAQIARVDEVHKTSEMVAR